MDELELLQNFLIVGAVLFGLGLVGFLVRRNMIVMFLCAEMMLQGVSVSLIAWGRFHGSRVAANSALADSVDAWGGQMLVIFIITVAACEAAIALALVLMIVRRTGTLDIAFWQLTREANQPPYVDIEVPESAEVDRTWPHLTPAGTAPPQDQEALAHRSRV